ncbi:MAG TPA: protein kinase [Verrucomicrobiae bacterium]|jgi:serine/threonine protein kinase/TolB-like protein/Tfp pilus assembly protein PilF|nr:protein kinase [Verrucomicrobiae bacterium]
MASASHRWQRIEALFYEALELKPELRPDFLDKNCDGDLQLRKEIEELLDSEQRPMDFLHEHISHAASQVVSEETTQPFSAGFELAHYKVISLAGAGGMGEVYLAEDTRLGRKVALKMLKPDLTRDAGDVRRFKQEALAASALNHPNILTVYELGQAEGVDFIASEFIEGQTLRQRIKHGKLDPMVAIDIGVQIASALSAAHARGIIHRDIKPDNVIVRTDGLVKVLDFGIAKLTDRRVEETVRRRALALASAASEPGMVRGTAKYMSPEQARGQAVDARSDIFSLGSVLYELITGQAAFEGDTTSDVIANLLTADPVAPSALVLNLPWELERILSKTLRKDREIRYQSAKEMLIDLQDLKNEAQFQARLQSDRPRSAGTAWGSLTPRRAVASPLQLDRKPRLGKWLVPLAALLVLFAVLTGYFVARRPKQLAITPVRTLAILPFRNLKADPQTDFLGFSLADEIITKMGYINALTVRPSSAVDKYRNQIIDMKKVAADLNVDTLLTGSYIKDGDDLRITAQLVDVKPDKILWRESIDFKYDKLLTVQDRVSEQIIKGLELNLSPTEARNVGPEKPISNAAYEAYLRGIDFYSRNDFSDAIQALEKSTALESNYAPSWAALGRAYTTHASLEFGGREDYNKAQTAYEKAISLNPSLVEPRIYMANLLTDTGRVEQAVPLLRSVLRESPNNAEAHWELGYAYRFAGMLRESVEECEKARQNNPEVKINSSALNSYLYLGEYDKFLQSLPVSDHVYILFYHGLAEYHLGNRQQAAEDFDRAFARDPSLLPADVGKALSDSMRHHNAEGLKLLQNTETKVEESGVTDAEGLYKLAQAFAVLGDKSSALHMLRHSIGGGFFCYPYFVRDPLMANLHGEPEYDSLLSQAKTRHEQFKASFF